MSSALKHQIPSSLYFLFFIFRRRRRKRSQLYDTLEITEDLLKGRPHLDIQQSDDEPAKGVSYAHILTASNDTDEDGGNIYTITSHKKSKPNSTNF